MSDQAETLRQMMRSVSSEKRESSLDSRPTLSFYLAPSVREKRLFSPRAFSLHARDEGVLIRVLDVSGKRGALSGDEVLVLGSEERDLLDAYSRIKERAIDGSVNDLNILVLGALDEVEAKALFSRLSAVSRRFLGGSPHFLGFLRIGEKFRESLAIREFLLHCRSRARGCPKRREADAI